MRPQENRSNQTRWVSIFLAFCIAAAPAIAQRGAPVLPDPGNPSMTRNQQQKLGLQVAREVYKQMPVLPDSSPLTKYVQKIGERLAKTIPPEHSWPFQFHVIEQKEINAFALPGGPMFVNVGTIRSAENEAELAGVMAHEMAHVYMQHSAKQQQKSSLLGGLAGIAGAIAGAWGGNWGTLAQTGIQFGAGTLMLKYSRADEAQADAVGAIIMWKADYDPIALADFFEKLEKQGGSGPQFLSDHPNPGNRRAAIEREIVEWPDEPYRHDDAEFAAARKEAEKAPAYSAQEISDGAKSGRWSVQNRNNGAVLPGTTEAVATVPAAPMSAVQPSSEFRVTALSTMRIARPDNWYVTRGQEADSATIAPPAGTSGGSVAYGVIIQVVRPQGSNVSLQRFTLAVAQNLQSNDANMQQTDRFRQFSISGRTAGSVGLQTISPMPGPDGKSQAEQDWLVTIPRGDGTAIVLIFVSPQRHFDQLKPTFDRMLRSISF
jgi:hypothetical protein